MKNTIFRKIIAGVMCLGILLSMIPAMAAEAYDYTETIDKVTALNVVPEKIDASASVTRKDLAKFLYYMLNVEENGSVFERDNFYDVDKSNEYYEYISAIAGYGLMSGVEEGVFAPDLPATFDMAVRVLIHATGYYPLVREGDAASYAQVAGERGLLKNVYYIPDQTITMGELSQLIWNALDMTAVETTIAGNSAQVVTNVKLLWYYHKIGPASGQITANEFTSLTSRRGVEKGYVRVGTTLYKAGADNLSDLLGKYVDFYYKKSDDFSKPVILWAKAQDANIQLFTNKDELIADSNKITYREGRKEKDYNLEAEVNVIYNGKRRAYDQNDINNLVIGSVELIDADSNKEYETIIVKSYIPYVVSSRDAEAKIIYDVIGRENGSLNTIYISDDASYKVTKDRKTADLVNLEVDDVALVAADLVTSTSSGNTMQSADSRATVYEILASSKVITGIATEVNTEEEYAIIEGEMYDTSVVNRITNYGTYGKTVQYGELATYYVDSFGQIVLVRLGKVEDGSVSARVDGTIGFITKVTNPAKAKDEITTIRVFDDQSAWNTYPMAEKVRIDGEVYKNQTEIYNYLTGNGYDDGGNAITFPDKITPSQEAGYTVTFRTNADNEVNFIDTSYVNSVAGETTSETMHYSKDLTAGGGVTNYGGITGDYLNLFPQGKTLLSVPVIRDGATGAYELLFREEAAFKWQDTSFMSAQNDVRYPLQFWNMEADMPVPEFAVYYNTTAFGAQNLGKEYVNAMVTGVKQTINEDGDQVVELSIISNEGKRVIQLTEKTECALEKGTDLDWTGLVRGVDVDGVSGKINIDYFKKGDIILYHKGTDGITTVTLSFRPYNDNGSLAAMAHRYTSSQYGSSKHKLWGNLYRITDDIIQLWYAGDPVSAVKYPFKNNGTGISIICYDYDTNEIEAITQDELKDYIRTGNVDETDKILFRRLWGTLKEVFIYRNAK